MINQPIREVLNAKEIQTLISTAPESTVAEAATLMTQRGVREGQARSRDMAFGRRLLEPGMRRLCLVQRPRARQDGRHVCEREHEAAVGGSAEQWQCIVRPALQGAAQAEPHERHRDLAVEVEGLLQERYGRVMPRQRDARGGDLRTQDGRERISLEDPLPIPEGAGQPSLEGVVQSQPNRSRGFRR